MFIVRNILIANLLFIPFSLIAAPTLVLLEEVKSPKKAKNQYKISSSLSLRDLTLRFGNQEIHAPLRPLDMPMDSKRHYAFSFFAEKKVMENSSIDVIFNASSSISIAKYENSHLLSSKLYPHLADYTLRYEFQDQNLIIECSHPILCLSLRISRTHERGNNIISNWAYFYNHSKFEDLINTHENAEPKLGHILRDIESFEQLSMVQYEPHGDGKLERHVIPLTHIFPDTQPHEVLKIDQINIFDQFGPGEIFSITEDKINDHFKPGCINRITGITGNLATITDHDAYTIQTLLRKLSKTFHQINPSDPQSLKRKRSFSDLLDMEVPPQRKKPRIHPIKPSRELIPKPKKVKRKGKKIAEAPDDLSVSSDSSRAEDVTETLSRKSKRKRANPRRSSVGKAKTEKTNKKLLRIGKINTKRANSKRSSVGKNQTRQ